MQNLIHLSYYISKVSPSLDFQSHFNEKGFALKKGVFSSNKISAIETEFDRIVAQLQLSGEHINARWGSELTHHIENSDGHSRAPAIHDNYTLNTAKPIETKKGDILFFHCYTIHCSMPNLSDKPRKTILVQLYSGKDKVLDNNQHTNIQLVLRGWNHHATRNSVSTIKANLLRSRL